MIDGTLSMETPYRTRKAKVSQTTAVIKKMHFIRILCFYCTVCLLAPRLIHCIEVWGWGGCVGNADTELLFRLQELVFRVVKVEIGTLLIQYLCSSNL